MYNKWMNEWICSKECAGKVLVCPPSGRIVGWPQKNAEDEFFQTKQMMQLLLCTVYTVALLFALLLFLVASISADSLPGCHACVIILCFYCIWRINEWMNKSDRRNISIEVNKSPRRSIKCRSICPTLSILHSELLCPLLFPIVSTDAAIFKHVFYDYALGIIVIFAALWLWRY